MKPAKILYYVFLAAIAAVAALLMVSRLPITGNYEILTVLSGSMAPAIGTGSVVIVKPAANYRIGDIITFRGAGARAVPVTHRIVEIRVESGNPVFITKGDVNNAPDTRQIAERDIIGRMMFAVPYAGYAVSAAQKPYGFLALIVIPAAIIVFDQLVKMWREVRRMRAAKRGNIEVENARVENAET